VRDVEVAAVAEGSLEAVPVQEFDAVIDVAAFPKQDEHWAHIGEYYAC
jgi:hypothetical protein